MTTFEIREDGVAVLDLGDDENRFADDRLAAWEAAIGEVERQDGIRALVTTASGRFFSNGLVLERVQAAPAERDPYLGRVQAAPAERDPYLGRVQALYTRILALPCVTVAAVPGHAFGGGAMLTLVHDLAVMREDRGFWCLPETSLGVSFTDGMVALIRDRLAPAVAREAMVTSKRYGGGAAAAAGIVDRAVPEADVLPTALAIAAEHAALAGSALRETKSRLHAPVIAALLDLGSE